MSPPSLHATHSPTVRSEGWRLGHRRSHPCMVNFRRIEARSMQDLATRNFENLRQEGYDDVLQPKIVAEVNRFEKVFY
ncbi:hypothetical protein QVD17_23877 [Tagetes erecta]|uniref:Uncharacterized protein n=1 Tax=Tagetes erecta TaxID=13708 RepID=A0AAD8NUR3_TARER|nr:hypothetical protein QVD17_23877 [Tagetes erecta]